MSQTDESQWLRETCQRLPVADCAGCTLCATRCMGNLSITRTEYRAIRDYLAGEIFQPTLRRQCDMAQPCEFSDPEGPRCLIYPVRPLICRLFGIAAWLPCPTGEVRTVVHEGPAIMQQYRKFERRSFREWMRQVK